MSGLTEMSSSLLQTSGVGGMMPPVDMSGPAAEPNLSAADRLTSARRVLVKIGSSLLINPRTGGPNLTWLHALSEDIAKLCAEGRQVIVVSSGSVALGRRKLGLSGALKLAEKQAAASVGQQLLMKAWSDALGGEGLSCAQVLLTRDDTEQRQRWLNGRATLEALLDLGLIPIINENDTVATDEIRYGDNDRLAARAAQLARADLLVLLSDIDGLYSRDPRKDPLAEHLSLVPQITPEIEAMAGGANLDAGVGTGGMATKIMAAKMAGEAGVCTLITQGLDLSPLSRLLAGGRATCFLPQQSSEQAYKQWIAASMEPKSRVVIDAGAEKALLVGASLLPSGILTVEGSFDRGGTLKVEAEDGRLLALGLARYPDRDLKRLIGLGSSEFEAAIGYFAGAAAIHRDDLVLLGQEEA